MPCFIKSDAKLPVRTQLLPNQVYYFSLESTEVGGWLLLDQTSKLPVRTLVSAFQPTCPRG